MASASREYAIALLRTHDLAHEPLEEIRGWSNEVWLGPTHVVRRSSGRFRESFRHEVEVLRLIKGEVSAPSVVAYGKEENREWMIAERITGQSLLSLWPAMPEEERREAVRQFASNLKALHQVTLPEDFSNPWMDEAVNDPEKAADLYHAAPEHYPLILKGLRSAALADERLLESADAFLAGRMSLFDRDTHCLVHGDAHFNNVLWDGETLTLLDFEASFKGAVDMELDMIMRFAANPVMVFGDSNQDGGKVDAAMQTEFADVVPWLQEFYPEIFDTANLQERLEVYELMMQLHQLHHFPKGHAYDPRPKLRALLAGDIA